MKVPLGHTSCGIKDCTFISKLYEGLPKCVECGVEFCPDHGTLLRGPDEGDWGKGTCTTCLCDCMDCQIAGAPTH